MIYLDANATTPLADEVLKAMLPWLREGYANPSGIYTEAIKARLAIQLAREQVASAIGAQTREIFFTSGGTESVNTALHSLDALTGEGNAVVSAIEHSAVLRWVESRKRSVAVNPVTRGGRVDMAALPDNLKDAAYVSMMLANNETGVIQPIQEIASLAHSHGLPIHTDAIQALGKIPINVNTLGVDMLSISAHKFHGPKGIGALFVREGLRFEPLLRGGGQEDGRRSGTENTAAIVGMGLAAQMASAQHEFLAQLRDVFERKVLAEVPGVWANGDPQHRLPNTSHLSFDQCDASGLLILLDEAGIACSAGSACMSGKQRPSHVQLAMGISVERSKSSLRISFSRLNTPAEAESAATALGKAVEKLRRVQGGGVGPVQVYSA